MEQDRCIRCGGRMEHIRQEKLQLGEYGVLTGHMRQLISGALAVDIYCCRDCRKLEFYAAGPGGEDGDAIAQVPCPRCGQFHEMDDPKCPYCGAQLLE